MRLTARNSVYLFKIGQKLHRRQRVDALMKCPECDTYAHNFTLDEADAHVTIIQRIYNNAGRHKDIEYVVIGCGGYWVVDPETLGLPRGNWQPTWEIIKHRLAKYAEVMKGWDLDKLPLEEDNKMELAAHINNDERLSFEEKADLLEQLDV